MQCTVTDFKAWLTTITWEIDNDDDSQGTHEAGAVMNTANSQNPKALEFESAEWQKANAWLSAADKPVVDAHVTTLNAADSQNPKALEFASAEWQKANTRLRGTGDDKGRLSQRKAGLVVYASRENSEGHWHNCIHDVNLRVELSVRV